MCVLPFKRVPSCSHSKKQQKQAKNQNFQSKDQFQTNLAHLSLSKKKAYAGIQIFASTLSSYFLHEQIYVCEKQI